MNQDEERIGWESAASDFKFITESDNIYEPNYFTDRLFAMDA